MEQMEFLYTVGRSVKQHPLENQHFLIKLNMYQPNDTATLLTKCS